MTGIKRTGTWPKRITGSIWHTESFEDADRCLMCKHQIPHSLKEHQMVLAKWPAPKELTKKQYQSRAPKNPQTGEPRAAATRRQHKRREFQRQVWARP